MSVLSVDAGTDRFLLHAPLLRKIVLVADARDGYVRVVETAAVEAFLLRRLGLNTLEELELDGVVLDRGGARVVALEAMVGRIIAVPD